MSQSTARPDKRQEADEYVKKANIGAGPYGQAAIEMFMFNAFLSGNECRLPGEITITRTELRTAYQQAVDIFGDLMPEGKKVIDILCDQLELLPEGTHDEGK